MQEIDLMKYFCDDKHFEAKIIDLVAQNILGEEQYTLIAKRYGDMKKNFMNVTKSDAAKCKDRQVWQFSEGVTPFCNIDRNRDIEGPYYSDASSAVIPITHTVFSDYALAKTKDGYMGCIGVDIPIWFNKSDNKKGMVMIVAQDPLRDPTWYSDREGGNRHCDKAIISTPFGLHYSLRRNSGRGGKSMRLVVEYLLNNGYGVYLTDCMKYFFYSHKESAIMAKKKEIKEANLDALASEIKIVAPAMIVPFGDVAYRTLNDKSFKDKTCLANRIIGQKFPHFSGLNYADVKKFLEIYGRTTIVEMAEKFAQKIIKEISRK